VKRPTPKTPGDRGDGRFTHEAVADPEHSTYGKAALAALDKAKLAQKVKPKLLTVGSEAEAIEAAQSGKAQAALVSSTTAVAHPGGQLPVPLEPGQLEQTLAVCGHSPQHNNAVQLSTFIGADGKPTLKRFGFMLPGEDAPMSHP
jgi:ABC-type molybdate transport system substrate-binding protein